MEQGEIIVGLDIGTTEIFVVLAMLDEDRRIHIKGVGRAVSDGLNQGGIVNINLAAASIQKAIEECEKKSGFEIDQVFAGIGGKHIRGINSVGVVGVRGDYINQDDVDRVMEAARAVNVPEKEPIHLLTQEFIVDGQRGVKSPIGMAGKRLEVKVHVVFASETWKMNLLQSCENANLHVTDVVLEPLSSALAVLTPDEKEVGIVMIDIGGGTSSYVVYRNECIWHSGVIPMGGSSVTSDIAIGLRTPKQEAQKLKHKFGSAFREAVSEKDIIEVRSLSEGRERKVERRVLAEIIEARFREVFEVIKEDVERAGWGDTFASGIVLTGGSSSIPDLPQLAEEVFSSHVRVGNPAGVKGVEEFVSTPACSTAVGLIKYAAESSGFDYPMDDTPGGVLGRKIRGSFSEVFKKFF